MMKKRKNKNELSGVSSFDGLLNKKYGRVGTKKRDAFEQKSNNFIIGELLKEERRKAKLTQEEIAIKTGTKKSYISRIERGKSDIQFSTLFRIFEKGLGKTLRLSVS